MPYKNFTCEFCNEEIRKDCLGQHVAATHKNELVQLLLDDYAENGSIDYKTITKIMNDAKPSYNPIYSKLYSESRYFFGVKPMFFYEDCENPDKSDSAASYIRSDNNMETHKKFMLELYDKISLKQIMDYNIKLMTTSQEYDKLMRENHNNKKTINDLKASNDKLMDECNKLKKRIENNLDLHGLKDNETVDDLKQEIINLKISRDNCIKQIENYKNAIDTMENRNAENASQISMDMRMRLEEQYRIQDVIIKERDKLKKDIEKIKINVKKEAEKIVEKEKEKKRKEKEAKEKERKKAKKKAKKAALLAKAMEDSDSSDSDSDSNSSDSDSSDNDSE